MNLEQQVCSLDLAKRLKELGVKQESHLHWWESTYNGRFVVASRREIDRARDKQMSDDTSDWVLACSAFTVAELGEMLYEHASSLSIEKDDVNKWKIEILPKFGDWTREYDNSLPNALAKMLIYLIENKLLPTPPNNK
jgi:hypothetical protein